MITIEDVLSARERIAGKLHRTPVLAATRIGAPVGVSLSLKCESLQKTGSFKVRGALNALLLLGDEAKKRGVITVSAGNHAQALAYAAGLTGVKATVVMFEKAPRLKVEASRGYGAEVVLHGANSIESFAKARELEKERGLVFVHPFDDVPVAAGAGTVALEILEDYGTPDVLVVSIGGGGLLAGIATAMRGSLASLGMNSSPKTRIVGVEPIGAAAMRKSLDAGRPLKLDRIDTIADGLTAPMAGELTFPVIQKLVDDVVLVSDDEIREAMRAVMISAKLVAEPAAAAAVAAVTCERVGAKKGDRVVAVLSGGNVDLSRIAEVVG
jgi:threonine dehydratase